MKNLRHWSRVSYLRSLLLQSFPQVSDPLVHGGHLSVPLVQQLLAVDQPAALLQVVTVSSLKSQGLLISISDVQSMCHGVRPYVSGWGLRSGVLFVNHLEPLMVGNL